MELKRGYKMTEVGVVPNDWTIHTIGKTMRLINGRAFKPEDWKDQGIPIIRIQNLNSNDSAFNYYTGHVEDRHLVKSGDILFAWSGTTGTSFGARIWTGSTGVLNQHIFKVLPDQRIMSPRFAFLILQRVQEYIEKQAHGFKASFVHVKKSDLVNIQLTVPPSEAEQEAIAEALSDADGLIESLEQLIAKKRQLKQGAMQELLTGKRRLPGFSGKWEVKRFGEIAQPRMERVDPRRSGPYHYCVELEHIESGTGRLLAHASTTESSSLKSVFHRNDVLFGKLRAYLRKFWIADQEGICSTEIWVLVPRTGTLDKRFLFHIVTVDDFIEAASTAYGTHMPRSDWNVVKNYEVQLPTLPEQTAIATILSDMDAEVAALETKLAKARQIKQGMMQELLTGRIRLI